MAFAAPLVPPVTKTRSPANSPTSLVLVVDGAWLFLLHVGQTFDGRYERPVDRWGTKLLDHGLDFTVLENQATAVTCSTDSSVPP
jgi:hypothetical protein